MTYIHVGHIVIEFLKKYDGVTGIHLLSYVKKSLICHIVEIGYHYAL